MTSNTYFRWPTEVTLNTYLRRQTEVTSNTRWPTEVTSNTYFRRIASKTPHLIPGTRMCRPAASGSPSPGSAAASSPNDLWPLGVWRRPPTAIPWQELCGPGAKNDGGGIIANKGGKVKFKIWKSTGSAVKCLPCIDSNRRWSKPRPKECSGTPTENSAKLFRFNYTACDQFQISPAASPEILHHTVWRTWVFIAYSDKRLLIYTSSSHHITWHLCFQGWDNVLTELGNERVGQNLLDHPDVQRKDKRIVRSYFVQLSFGGSNSHSKSRPKHFSNECEERCGFGNVIEEFLKPAHSTVSCSASTISS